MDLNALLNMAHFCELLDQPLAASSSMIGRDYTYDFSPPPPPHPPHIPEEPIPHMNDSQRPAEEEEEATATTMNDPSPLVRPETS